MASTLPLRSQSTLLRDVLIYGSGTVLLRGTALITMPLFTRIFTPEDYGVWSVIIAAVGLVSPFLLLGGDMAYTRYFYEARTLRERQVLTSTWFLFLFVWSWVVIMLALSATGSLAKLITETPGNTLAVVLALVTAPVAMISNMLGVVLRLNFRAAIFSTLALLTALLTVGFSLVAVVVIGLGVPGAIGATLAALMLLLPARVWTARSLLCPVFSFALVPRLLLYGVQLVPGGLAYVVVQASDRLLLSRLSSLEQVGLYSIAASLVSVMTLLHQALQQAWWPHAVQAYEEDPPSAQRLYARMVTLIVAGFSLAAVLVATFAREILMLLTTPSFYPAASAVVPLSLGLIALGSTQVTALGMYLAKRVYFVSIFIWVAAGLNVALNLILIPRWGMLGAAWTTVASYLFLTLAYGIISHRLVPIEYERGRILKLTLLTIAFSLVSTLFPSLPLIAALPLKAAYVLAFAALLVAFGIIKKRELLAIGHSLLSSRGRKIPSEAMR